MTSSPIKARSSRFDSRLLPRANAKPAGDASLAGSVRRGAFWTAGSTLVMRFSNIAVMAVVARIMVPEEFGIFALAITVHAFVVSLAELGVASAVARSDLDIDKIAPTVSTIAIGTSLLLAAPMAFFAGDIAEALGNGAAASTIQIMSIAVALIGPFAVPGAILQRDFRQDLIFRATAVSFVAGSGALLGFGIAGWGADAFAWSRVIGQAVMGTMMLRAASRFYWPRFNKTVIAPLLGFGLPLALANLMSQVLLNVDNLFVGRLMGAADLGIYMLAFNISTWSTAVMGSMLNQVVLPGVSAVLRDGGDVPAAVAAAVRTVAWVAFPIAGFTFVFSGPIIEAVYGTQWTAGGPVLAVLSFYGISFILGLLCANVIIATGRTGVLFWVQAIALAGLLPALPAGIHFGGMIGAGVAHIVVISCITLPVYLVALRKATGTRIKDVFTSLVHPTLAAATAAVAAWAVTLPFTSAWLTVSIGGTVGATIYLGMTRKILVQVIPVQALWNKIAARKDHTGQTGVGDGAYITIIGSQSAAEARGK